MEIVISSSTNKNKKFDAVIDGKKKISFGASGYSDFTKHQDLLRRDSYIKRHSKEDWSKSNIASPAWMSRYILWEKPTLKSAVDNANKKYKDVKFILK